MEGKCECKGKSQCKVGKWGSADGEAAHGKDTESSGPGESTESNAASAWQESDAAAGVEKQRSEETKEWRSKEVEKQRSEGAKGRKPKERG